MRHANATTPLRGFAAALAGCAMIGAAALPSTAMADPASVAAKKREVRELKAKLDSIGARVGVVAERYNGARWRLSVI
ncbi:MAG: hypothetical protein ACPG7S_06045, partial [Miltoncostaeaceae bacterium]